MNRIILASAAVLVCLAAGAQDRQMVYSVTACPSEDTGSSMNISWAADTTITDSYVLVTKVNDRKWRRARRVRPERQELCTVFDSIYSKSPSNEDIYESARFLKCGAHIDGLKSDTDYKYIICGGETDSRQGSGIMRRSKAGQGSEARWRTESGQRVESGRRVAESGLCGEHRFRTAGAEEWSCCIISDFHSYTPLGKRLDCGMNMVETVRAYDPQMDWVLHVGDVCAWGGSYSFWRTLYERPQFSDFFWAGVNGNHDNMSRRYELSNEYFRNTAFYPRNGYGEQSGVCYHFRYSDALFIMLNSECMRKEEGLREAQDWVREVVRQQNASPAPPRYIIVVEHYQWFLGDCGRDLQYGRWCRVFDELGVDLAISGNDHVYCRTGCVYEGKKTDDSRGTMYLTTSSSDNERGRKMDELTENQELIEHRFTEGPNTISGMSMKVNPERIELTLLDRDGKIIDQATVKAKSR